MITITPTPSISVAPSVSPTPSPTPTPSVTISSTPTPTPTPTQVLYTLERVRANNSSTSCWTIIDGFVYDLTSWISAHPGGPGVIRSMCGTDGTNAFKAQHQNQMSPAQRLNGYLLGPLSR
ncbi:MAG: cytochrome b5 domain-containing protein [Candidatus Nanopelagicaceae bacterium]|nr:cytochrome b5 domain-containing protein [Candidatus Nanopelagicaceae bacterium]